MSAVFFKDYYGDGRPLDPGDAQPVTFDNSPTVPTVMFTDDAGYAHFGAEAQVRSQNNPDRLHSEFKMSLLKTEDDTQQGQAEDLTRAFLEYLHKAYQQQATFTEGAKVTGERSFISYPAKWPAPLREMMIDATRQAGFENAEGMIEPEAAMRYFLAIRAQKYNELEQHGIIARGQPVNVLLIDMGAGTTDLVLYRFVPGGSQQVLGSWPPIDRAERGAHLGGREIDEQLFSRVIEAALPEGFLDELGEEWTARFRQDTKDWKENTVSPVLSQDERVENLPAIIRQTLKLKGHEAPKLGLDRERFEGLFRDYLESFSNLVDGLIENIEDSGNINGAEDIDLVILTGGHSQWYFVEEMTIGELPGIKELGLHKIQKEPYRLLKGPHPQETVARGMALSGMPLPRSGEPLRIGKVAANYAWLSIKLGDTDIQPLPIQKIDDPLPIDKLVCTTIDYRFPSIDEHMPGKCTLMIGETLAGAKKFKPLGFAVSYTGLIRRLMRRAIPDDKADICLHIHVDENERYAVLGLVQSRRGKGYGNFAINRGFPNDLERRKLADAMAKHLSKRR
jgi:molecular chaperone DnaK (HSP70)